MKRTINKPKKKSHKKKLEIKKNSKPLNKTKKDERNLTEVINKRYNSLIFIVIILYVVILGRVFYLQIIKENDYKESLAMATEKTVESTSAPRGRIYDRNYNLLVDNEGVKTIYYKKQNGITNKEEIELAYTVADNINLDYSKVNENRLKTFYYKGHYKECKKKITDKEWEEYNKRKLNDKDIEKLIYERLDEEISTYDERDKKAAYIYYLMNKGYSYAEKVIKNKDVSEEEYAYISENIDNLKGFNTKLDWERVYLYGDTFKSILGNVSSNNQGIPSELAEIYLKKGYSLDDRVGISYLEYQYENYLKGTKAKYRLLSDNSYELVSEGKRGSDIVLTIDINLQKHLEEILSNEVYNAKGEAGTTYYNRSFAVIADPNTGEILGMSSRPNFNPNNYKDYSTEVINRNMAIWASYEPGSTFKILTVSAADNEGKVDLLKDTFYDGGSVNVDGARIKCWKAGGHGAQTFLEVVQNSCNPGFVELGRRLGKETLFDYINKFGYGKKTGIDLNGEGSGILFNLDKVGPVELATTAFGQGVSVTAIQQVAAVSAAINGGTLYKPYIVKRITEHETGQIIKEIEPTKVRENIVTKETSEKVRMTLESVVSLGTGRNSYIDGYRVGGKTGTAQKVNNGVYMHGNYIVSFIGFMPANDPKIVVYLAIDNPKGVTQYGGTVSAPIVKNILEDAISALNIKKQEGGTDKKYQWYDQKYYTVEDVVGLTKKEAASKLKSFTIEYSGSGDKVINQSPEAGSRIPEYSSIRLYLD